MNDLALFSSLKTLSEIIKLPLLVLFILISPALTLPAFVSLGLVSFVAVLLESNCLESACLGFLDSIFSTLESVLESIAVCCVFSFAWFFISFCAFLARFSVESFSLCIASSMSFIDSVLSICFGVMPTKAESRVSSFVGCGFGFVSCFASLVLLCVVSSNSGNSSSLISKGVESISLFSTFGLFATLLV